MEIVQRTNRGTPGGSTAAVRALTFALCLPLTLALGVILPMVTALPRTWAALFLLAICGALASVALLSVNLPVTPILRPLLLASFWIDLEINFFPILKYHVDPPGLNISLTLLASLALAGDWLIKRLRGKEREPVFPRRFALTLIGLWFWCALTVAYGSEGMLGIYGLWATAASVLLCFAAGACFSDRRALHQTAVAVAVALALNSLLGIAQSWLPSMANLAIGESVEEFPVTVEGEDVSRGRAMFGSSNVFAWTLVTFAPIVIAPLLLCAAGLGRRLRALYASGAGLMVIMLILTYSRGAWIAFAVSLPLMTAAALFIMKADERKRLIIRGAGVVALVSLLAAPFSGKVVSRLFDDDRGAAEVRLPLMRVAMAMITDNPVLGVGLSSYESVMRRYDETSERVTDSFDWPVHNVYLHIAAETGAPGLLLFLALTVMASLRGWRVLRDSRADPALRAMALGLLTGMAAFLITGLKEGGCFQTGSLRIFFLICGLSFATERANRKAAG